MSDGLGGREVSSFRSGVGWSILRAALIWAVTGTSAAAVVCFPLVYFWAIFVLYDAAPGALVFGTIQALWLLVEKSKAATSKEFIRFGFISGSGLGLLALPPALTRSEAVFSSWFAPAVFVVAALVGGGLGGALSALSFRAGNGSEKASRPTLRLIVGCCIVLVPLSLAEYHYYGPVVQSRLKVLAFLPKRAVVDLPTGNAEGSRWAGCYEFDYHNIGESGVGGGSLRVTQFDGRLTIFHPDRKLEGGVDSSGRFRAGSDTIFKEYEHRLLWKGQFFDDSHFTYLQTSTVLVHGNFSNSTVVQGAGRRVSCR